jgi:hypothetical protein
LPLIVVKVIEENDCNQNNINDIFDEIEGKLLPIESLKKFRNESLIDKVFVFVFILPLN